MAEQEIAFGLWQRPNGDGITTEIRDLAAFRSTLGDALIVGFAQLFSAANRIDAVLVLMGLNNRTLPDDAGYPDTAHNPDSIRAARNRLFLVAMLWGILHELNDAIETLKKAHLRDVLVARGKDPGVLASWKQLRCIAYEWRKQLPTATRNEMSFHLGNPETMIAGLDAWPKGEVLEVIRTDRAARADYDACLGLELVCRGLKIDGPKFTKLAELARDHADVSVHAMKIFYGALRGKGAPIPTSSKIESR